MQQENSKNEKKLHFWVDNSIYVVYYKSVPNMQQLKEDRYAIYAGFEKNKIQNG